MSTPVRVLPWIVMLYTCPVVAGDGSSLMDAAVPASERYATKDSGQAAIVPAAGSAQGLYKAYLLAKINEPTFQTSKAELEVNQTNASASRSAYYPQLQYNRTKLDTETVPRTTVQLAQPIFALDRWATFREASHMDILSDSTFDQREQELAARVFQIASDLARYSENLRSNQSKVNALNLQYESAQKMFQLGQGTITDVSATRVQLGQAKADGLNLEAKLEETKRLYAHTCGELPQLTEFKLVRRIRKLVDLDNLADVKESNTQVSIAKQNAQIAELDTLKAKSAAIPSALGIVTQSEANGVQSNYIGISISYPLQAQGLYGIASARANEMKAREQLREAEQKLQLNLESLKTLIKAGAIETSVRLETIESAETNVIANEKSFQGGVRSKTDVLNAIQQLFQANDDYVATLLTLAGNYMNYLLAMNVRTDSALERVNTFLFN